MNERAYKTMSVSGVGSVAIGIVVLVVGVTAGVLSIIAGAKLIKEKKNLIF